MSHAPGQYLGVTPPISLNGPTERDLEITKTLEEELRANDVFESPEEAKLRYVGGWRTTVLTLSLIHI